MTRAALYLRVSTRHQDTEAQRAACEEFARGRGFSITHTYQETAGGAADRPVFRSMMDAAYRREFDTLIFYSLDRLSREGTAATLAHLQRLTGYGVAFQSTQEPYLDTAGPFSDVIIGLLATIARFERARLRERIAAGIAQARKENRPHGRPRTVLDLAQIRDARAAGESWRSLAARLQIPESTLRTRLKQAGKV